jgi:transposase-like protein
MADDLPTATPPTLPDIIQRYLNGESMQEIAKESRTASRTLYRWMLTDAGPEYDNIITNCLTNRIADADELLDSAQDSCQVARAREIAKFARMDFERRRPKLYGPKQEIQTDSKITVIVQRQTPLQVVGSTVETVRQYDGDHVSEAEVIGNANEMPSSDNNGQLT